VELSEYADHDAVGLAELIRTGRVTAEEVDDAARRAIEAVEPALQATVGDLLDLPGSSGQDGPLAGVPFAVKDVSAHLAGQVVQYGSRWTGDGIPVGQDSYLGRRFRAAGLRAVARSRSPEFAFNASTEPRAHGPTHNPWDPGRSAGGSSGGAAALVAARALPIAHATDAAGSIRIPSALCGVVGLKPTRARIPIPPGLWESVHGMSHDFVITRTLRDAATALDVLHGPVAGDKYVITPPARRYVAEVGADPGRLRIRWTADAWSGATVAPQCRAAVEATAQALDAAGHDVRHDTPAIDVDLLDRALLTSWAAALAQRADMLERAVDRPASPDVVESVTLAMIELGRATTAVQLLDSHAMCNTIARAIGAFFETVDVLVLPVTARPGSSANWIRTTRQSAPRAGSTSSSTTTARSPPCSTSPANRPSACRSPGPTPVCPSASSWSAASATRPPCCAWPAAWKRSSPGPGASPTGSPFPGPRVGVALSRGSRQATCSTSTIGSTSTCSTATFTRSCPCRRPSGSTPATEAASRCSAR
jgi:amidase